MTPSLYLEAVVLPNVRRLLAQRDDIGLAYTSCVVTYHLADHIAHADGQISKIDVRSKLTGFCPDAFAIVKGLCNGTKHAEPRTGVNPGDEQVYPVFGFDVAGGWDMSRFDVPGLMVKRNGSEIMFIDDAVQLVLLALQAFYPQHLGALDLSFVDKHIRSHHQSCWAARGAP